MVLHCVDTEYVSTLVEYLESDSRNKDVDGVPDLGSLCDSDFFEEIMRECVSKRIQVDYSFCQQYCPRVFDADGMTKAMYNQSLQYRATKAIRAAVDQYGDMLVGVLPYKLLDVYTTPVAKDQSYIESTRALSKAKQVIDCINEHRKVGGLVKAEVLKSVRSYKL